MPRYITIVVRLLLNYVVYLKHIYNLPLPINLRLDASAVKYLSLGLGLRSIMFFGVPSLATWFYDPKTKHKGKMYS